MSKKSDLVYFIVLVFSGLSMGIILRDGDAQDNILLGVFLLAELFYFVMLGRNPKWITAPHDISIDNDDLAFRMGAWDRWENNLWSRRFAFVLSVLSSFVIGRIIKEFFISVDEESDFPASLLIVVTLVCLLIIFFSIRWFIRKEDELYDQRFWTKSNILEEIEQGALNGEILGSYEE